MSQNVLKGVKTGHEGIPYFKVKTPKKPWEEPGCYQLHRPSVCRQTLPTTGRPIHKCEYKPLEYIIKDGCRDLIAKRPTRNVYPAILHRSDYEKIQAQGKIVTTEEKLAAIKAQDEESKKCIKESNRRMADLKANLKHQPGSMIAVDGDSELNGPDQAAHTLSRAEILLADRMPGPHLCNRVILASKVHAIRDAQLIEKKLIKKELDEEERRLDAVMEANRQLAIKRANDEEKRRRDLRYQNLAALQEQIQARRSAKIMEAERITEESIRVNQANIAMQIDEAHKLKEKHHRQAKLKETLDQSNAAILFFKQLQNEEERISNLRIENFLKQKTERESLARKEALINKAAKEKGISHIAAAQKAEQELKEELTRIRYLKISEDFERECRRKDMIAAIKRNRDMKALHEARVAQIRDIHRTIAHEIAKDEQIFNNVARENEEYMRKEKELEERHKARVEQHRQEIMNQINAKERARADLRESVLNQGVVLRMKQNNQERYEMKVIKMKVDAMRKQKIAEVYVKEVEQTLAKHGYWN